MFYASVRNYRGPAGKQGDHSHAIIKMGAAAFISAEKGSDQMKSFLRKKKLFLVLVAPLLLCSCLYVQIQRPMGAEFNKTELGTKVGEAHNYAVLWLVAWGDAGTKAAADNGGIKVIRHSDVKVFAILFGLYTKVTTVVYGD